MKKKLLSENFESLKEWEIIFYLIMFSFNRKKLIEVIIKRQVLF